MGGLTRLRRLSIYRPHLWLIRIDVVVALVVGLPLLAWLSPLMFSAHLWHPLDVRRFGVSWLSISTVATATWLFMKARAQASAGPRVSMGLAAGPTGTIAVCVWSMLIPSQLAIRSAERPNRALITKKQIDADLRVIRDNLPFVVPLTSTEFPRTDRNHWIRNGFRTPGFRTPCVFPDHAADRLIEIALRYEHPEDVSKFRSYSRRIFEDCKRGGALMETSMAWTRVSAALHSQWERAAKVYRDPERRHFDLIEIALGIALFMSLVQVSFTYTGATLTWGLGVVGIVALSLFRISLDDPVLRVIRDDLEITHPVWALSLTAFAGLVIACRSWLAQHRIGSMLIAVSLLLPAFCALALLMVRFIASGYDNVGDVGHLLGFEVALPTSSLQRAIPVLTIGALVAAPFWGAALDKYQIAPRSH